MPADGRIVVVGGGLATTHACQQARRQGFEGELTVLSAERHPPYDRPPPSKAVLAGDIDDTARRFDTDAWPWTYASAPPPPAWTSTRAGCSPRRRRALRRAGDRDRGDAGAAARAGRALRAYREVDRLGVEHAWRAVNRLRAPDLVRTTPRGRQEPGAHCATWRAIRASSR